MRNRRFHISGLNVCALFCAVLLGAAAFTPWAAPSAQKLKPEELVAKHLEAIGTAELRAPAPAAWRAAR